MAELNAKFSIEQKRLRVAFSLEQTTIPAIFKINAAGTTWGSISGNIQNQTDLINALNDKQDVLTAGENVQIEDNVISATDTTYTAGQGIDITNGVISNTQTSAEWGNIQGNISDQTDLVNALNEKQDTISDLDTIRESASEGASAYGTIQTYGDIVTYDAADFATATQGGLADTALQPGDDISELNNDAGYITSASIPTNYVTTNTVQTITANKTLHNAELITDNMITLNGSTSLIRGLSGINYRSLLRLNASGVLVGSVNENLTLQGDTTRPKYNSNDLALYSDLPTLADLTTQAQLDAINSGATATNIGQITTNENDIADIRDLIPTQATSSNQLADKDFVNSSIATNTANFIGTFNSVAELEAYSGPLTNNDYAFVATTDSAGNTLYDRYKYNADTQEWLFEYELNNSSFTAAQWASINSGITSGDVSLIQSALQPNDNVSELVNDAGYITSASLPIVNDGTLTINVNGTVTTFSANQSTDSSATINIPTDTADLTNGAGFITSSALADYVTTNTTQTITARKTFTGEKAIYFKQDSATNKLGFTLYNPSNTELGAFEYRPNTISGSALLNVNTSYANSCYVGFRYWGTAVNIVAPKVATAGDYYIPTHITDGNTTVTASNAGTVNISTLLPTVNDGTITINQGGTQKGTFTLNQSGNSTIDLDAGGGTDFDVVEPLEFNTVTIGGTHNITVGSRIVNDYQQALTFDSSSSGVVAISNANISNSPSTLSEFFTGNCSYFDIPTDAGARIANGENFVDRIWLNCGAVDSYYYPMFIWGNMDADGEFTPVLFQRGYYTGGMFGGFVDSVSNVDTNTINLNCTTYSDTSNSASGGSGVGYRAILQYVSSSQTLVSEIDRQNNSTYYWNGCQSQDATILANAKKINMVRVFAWMNGGYPPVSATYSINGTDTDWNINDEAVTSTILELNYDNTSLTVNNNKLSVISKQFIAEYGVTTFQEVLAAYNDNKKILVKINKVQNDAGVIEYAELTNVNILDYPVSFRFSCVDRNSVTGYLLEMDNTWSEIFNGLLEAQSNKITSISSSSTNTQYPSAKCVYDNLQSKADTDFSNVTNTANILMAHNAMLSDTVYHYTIGASGTQYIAPADGLAFATRRCTVDAYYDLNIIAFAADNTTQLQQDIDVRTINGYIFISIPVRKNQHFSVEWYSGSAGYVEDIGFIYAVGSESEAS